MISDEEIGMRIKKLRKMNNYTQEKFAEVLCIGEKNKIYRIEKGIQSMTANELIKLCSLLNISLDNLIDDKRLSSKDFIEMSRRYILNSEIKIEERKEVVSQVYLELASRELSEMEMHHEMRNTNENNTKISDFEVEKYGIDDIL